MDRRAGTGPRGRAGLLFLLRAEPLQAAHHFAPHAQAHHHAARRARTPRRPRHPAPLPAARLTAAQYAALRTALRQPHRRLYRRTVEDGSADGGDRPRTAPHPYPVLHPQRRPDGLPPAGRPGRKGARRRPGTHPLRRRRQPGCQELLFQRDARRRDRSIRLPARQIPALHQQGQLPQPPQDRRDRRPHRIHRRHEHRRPLRPRHPMGHMARHPFPDRGQRRRGPSGVVPERLVGDYENAYFGAGVLPACRAFYRRHPANRPQRPVRQVARPVAGRQLRHRPRPAADLDPDPLLPALGGTQHGASGSGARRHRCTPDASGPFRLESRRPCDPPTWTT